MTQSAQVAGVCADARSAAGYIAGKQSAATKQARRTIGAEREKAWITRLEEHMPRTRTDYGRT